MNYYRNIHIILFNIIISNALIIHQTNELYKNIENQTFITNDDLNQLIRENLKFLQLTLRENKYYTGSDASLCPLPYDKNTLLDDPDVKKLKYFDPRECEKPWSWTQQNQIIVPVPKEFTIDKKLGDLVRQDSNLEIIQKYTYYLNTIESVGITLVDRFCLFLVEAIDRIDSYSRAMVLYPFPNITVEYLVVNVSIYNFKKLFKHMYKTFKQYFISTLPFDCMLNILNNIYPNDHLNNFDGLSILKTNIEKYKDQLLECRQLSNLKKNYAILENDDLWKWDITSKDEPNDRELIKLHQDSVRLGAVLFNVTEVFSFMQ
ncbi:uncharacterized protein LOC126901990 isoform X5 [Daktulosphaira vitifoliae]|uniref:uncharacterized protein LOC126901990 isoform X5 n=1 Tax=Daktulosphaira vitifoliae TaxID=58002 RepID=UPI0021AA4617|nr:uncharacterized protein LOC126901990 isoform X5 [Daktulosphaira vitifoliae]